MKRLNLIILIVTLSSILTSCDTSSLEEYVFKQAIISKLSERCTENDKNCVKAVETQTSPCADKADWKSFYQNKDDKHEKLRFQKAFFACIVDPKGNPYFSTHS